METLSTQDVVEFSIKQTEAEKLKELISARHTESLDTSNLIDATACFLQKILTTTANV
jgi:hypothetical protein